VAPEPPQSLPPKRHCIVLWDVENCSVPSSVSASDTVSAIRLWLTEKGWPGQDCHVVTSYNVFARQPAFWKSLSLAGCEQVAAGPKQESADRELEARMRREVSLLPTGEDRTCFVLISSDMDFLKSVRDELRTRVTVFWIRAASAGLSESTLRQIEECVLGCPPPRVFPLCPLP
jgi:hypothetical protein